MHLIFLISLLLCASAQNDLFMTTTKRATPILEKVSLPNGTYNKNETIIAKNRNPQETATIISLILNNEDVRGESKQIIGGSSSISKEAETKGKDATTIMEKLSLPVITSNKNETQNGNNRDSHETTTNTTSILKDEDVRNKSEHSFGGSSPNINEPEIISNETEINIRSISNGKGSGGGNNLVADLSTKAPSTLATPDFNTKAPSTLATPDSKEEERCESWTGENGICVKYNLCEENLEDADFIDLHIRIACSSYLDVCCSLNHTASILKDEDDRNKSEHSFGGSSPNINEPEIISNETEINIRSISNGKGSGGGNNLVADFSTKAPSTIATPDFITKASSTLATSDSKEEEELCESWTGENGICVKYYLCEENLEDTDLIDLHIRTACSSYLDVCCSLNHTAKTTHPPQDNKNLKNGSSCGRRNPGGVGFSIAVDSDKHANFGEFPWMVAVLSVRNESKADNESQSDSQEFAVYLGGGSLINPSVVLSAAHLFTMSRGLRIRAGEWDTQTRREIYQHQERDVQEVLLHENYTKSNLYYDVALLFLSTPVEMAPHVGTACLPPAGAVAAPGTHCFASGWGKNIFGKEGFYSVTLKKVELPVVEKVVCRELLCKTRLGRQFELHPSFMCAGGETGVDTCTGDGGSPLVCPINGESERYEQSGVVSWGIGCGEDRTPGVYADVSAVRGWIDDKVAGRGFDPATYTY